MGKILLTIPEGMIVDVENSDLQKGIIKLKRKEDSQKKWEDFGRVYGWYIDSFTNVSYLNEIDGESSNDHNKNTYPTESLANAALALSQLLQWRNKVWKEDCDWKPDWHTNITKYTIISQSDRVITGTCSFCRRVLAFRTEEIRDQFLKDHKDLIEEAKELI